MRFSSTFPSSYVTSSRHITMLLTLEGSVVKGSSLKMTSQTSSLISLFLCSRLQKLSVNVLVIEISELKAKPFFRPFGLQIDNIDNVMFM